MSKIFKNKKLSAQIKPASQVNPLTNEEINFIKSLVIFEDNSLIALNKPSGLATQSGSGIHKSLDTLSMAFCVNPKKKPKLVHRLDRETSGVIILAKNRTSAAMLSEEFASKHAQKTYIAIVSGETKETGEINAHLKRGRQNGIDLALIANENDKDAQNALTIYKTIKTKNGFSLVELNPKTGRMHQLRAHLSHIGHPIIGDNKYGGSLMANGKLIERVMLHAQELNINTLNGPKTFTTDAPKDMQELIKTIFGE